MKSYWDLNIPYTESSMDLVSKITSDGFTNFGLSLKCTGAITEKNACKLDKEKLLKSIPENKEIMMEGSKSTEDIRIFTRLSVEINDIK
jgi:hypothetical protein